MKIPVAVLALLVLVVVFAFIVPMASARHEPFMARDQYIQEGRQRYNPFADNIDTTRPNFAMAETSSELADATKSLYDVMNTAGIEAKRDDGTYLSVIRDVVTARVPTTTKVARDTQRCETLKGRGSCATLNNPDYAQCGVCLKDGTTYDGKNPGTHIGGLLLLPEDKMYQLAEAKDRGTTPIHSPTAGSCPTGYFFADRASCDKAVNRFDCAESGTSGGFNGVTADGRSVAVAKCAQAPFSGDNVFIYDPKNRRFNINLRVLTPNGTGQARIYVYDARNNQVGYGTSNTPGKEFLVTVNNVSELQDLRVVVALEAPQRTSGNKEVFQYSINEGGTTQTRYNQTASSSVDLCSRIGTRIATKDELVASWNNGAQLCSSGWTADSSAGHYPITAPGWTPGCGGPGIQEYTPNGMANTWCFGVKPPQSSRQDLFNATVFPFFNSLGDSSSPPQSDKGNQWSQYGDSYQAPFFRAVLLQWEISDQSMTRTAGFESSIAATNQVPTDLATGINKVLRKFGTFKSSKIIQGPRPNSATKMITNQFWLWSNMPKNQYTRFDVKVPGVFLDPYYPEDKKVAPSGPIITTPETATFLRVSPCLRDGEKAGAYSLDCLTNLFSSSGGDSVNGKLANTNGGLAQLNKYGDMDAISGYIDDLYSLATTGRDTRGSKSTMKKINAAAQMLFGFDIMTPCENITEDSEGKIMLIQKTGGLAPDCLDYLWMNTGSDQSRGNESRERKSTISNTYTSIGERYSGLRNKERTKAAREIHPFQTCQRAGSYAPIGSGGENATNVNGINSTAISTRNKACAANRNDPRCSSGSVVSFVQDAYNSIFQTANAGSGSEGAAAQETAVSQCYGVKKVPSPPPTSVTLRQGQVVGNVNMPTGNYTLKFTLTLRGTVGNWGSIIHVTNGENCCNQGQRAPAIWTWPGGTGLHVSLGDDTDGNWRINETQSLPIGQAINFNLTANGRNITLVVNNETYRLTQPTRRSTGNNYKVYMADPFYEPANAAIDDFEYVVDGVPIQIKNTT